MKKTGISFALVLRQRRLRDYKSYIHLKQGFNHEIINELKNKIKHFSDIERLCWYYFVKWKLKRIYCGPKTLMI